MRISSIGLKRYIRDEKKEIKKVQRGKDFFEAVQMKRKVLAGIKSRDVELGKPYDLFVLYR